MRVDDTPTPNISQGSEKQFAGSIVVYPMGDKVWVNDQLEGTVKWNSLETRA